MISDLAALAGGLMRNLLAGARLALFLPVRALDFRVSPGQFAALASFNVLGDPDIAELGNLVASLANENPDALRSHPEVRKAATARASEILGNLDSWLSPPALQQAAE